MKVPTNKEHKLSTVTNGSHIKHCSPRNVVVMELGIAAFTEPSIDVLTYPHEEACQMHRRCRWQST